MKTTHESTGLDDQNRARREGSELWGRTKVLLDELQAFRAAQQPDPTKVAAAKSRAIHAGNSKTQRLHDAIATGVERYRLQLVNWTGTDTSRACWLTRRIYPNGKTDKAGRPCGWRTVYNHLKTLSV